MSGDPLLELVQEYLERREVDSELSAESFCAEHPSAGGALLARIRGALQAESRLREAASAAPAYVGPYRVVRPLGRGGMGLVHEVERDGARYALKRLHPGLASERAAERFRREGRILARVRHPGVVGVLDSGSADGEPYLVLTLVEGRPLTDVARTLALAERVRIVVDLARAVDAVHAAGLLHRDLKPANVLLREDRTPVLVDFGLGSADDDAALTSTGDLLGTPRYMAPEQARGRPADVRTDVWGLGQILFELATGRAALDECSRTDALRAVSEGRLRRAREIAPDVPRELERVLATALALEPRHRYASAAELAGDLERFLRGEPVRARPPGAWTRGVQWARRHPGRAATLGTAAAFVIVLLTWAAVAARSAHVERRSLARSLTEEAVFDWTMGEPAAARRTVERALALADDPAARGLRDLLDGRAGRGAGSWSAAFAACDAGDHADAARRFDALASDDALAGILAARALRLAADLAGAERELAPHARRAPSLLAVCERAAIARERGDVAGALAGLRAARALAPDDMRVGRDLACALLESGAIADGVRLAVQAHELGLATGRAGPADLSRWLRRASDRQAARAELARRLEVEPRQAHVRFALAVLLDADHLVAEAARAYEELLAVAPRHGFGLVFLAHLRFGADRGRCAACDRVFDATPELVDAERAREMLVQAVTVDRGHDPELLRTIVGVARDHREEAPVIAALEVVLADGDPGARVRLEDALASLRR